MNKITVIGSINLDTNLQVEHLARPGETVHADKYYSAAGGKGANQAVAAQRLGGEVHFIGAVGRDSAGEQMLAGLKKEGIDTTEIKISEQEATGQAFVMVEESGQNSITIYSGSNYDFGAQEVEAAQAKLMASDFVVTQLETPLEAAISGFKLAHRAGVKTLLNPAPAISKLPQELLANCDLIVPNETEAQTITGIEVVDEASAQLAAQKMHELGVPAVIITIGAKGAYYDINGQHELVPALKVKTVDTTAAGDTFIGALVSVLMPDFSNSKEAVTFANRASALAVQRRGAQPSIPYRREVD